MALQSVMDGVRKVFQELEKHREEHERKCAKMSDDEAKTERAKRIEEYRSLCLCGATSMLWKDTYTMTKKLHGYSPAAAGMTSLFSLLALFSIVIGLVASIFSRSAPYAVAIAANGGLWSMMFLIMVCHLEMMEFLPVVLLAIICVLFLATFIGYWYYCGRDLTVLLKALKYIFKIICIICIAFIAFCWYLFRKVMGLFWRTASRDNEQNDGLALNDYSLPLYYSLDEMTWRQHNTM